VLSIHPEAQYGQRAAMAGASGCLNRVSDAHRPSGASSPLCRVNGKHPISRTILTDKWEFTFFTSLMYSNKTSDHEKEAYGKGLTPARRLTDYQ
jgi:hypothetical protein